jgi:hypothetical protein
VVTEWALDVDQLAVLEAGLRAADRMAEAEATVKSEGLTVAGSKGQPRPHPLLATIDVERRAFLAALKALDLERDDPARARDWKGRYAKGDLRGRESKGHTDNVRPMRGA